MVECHCVLPQYRHAKNPPYHKLVVFSVLDDSDTIIPKQAVCNNCGVVHNVYDITKSEIKMGKELGACMEISDLGLLLPTDIKNILETYDCELPVWEEALFVLQNEKWGSNIIVSRKYEDFDESGKILKINGPGKYLLEPYFIRRQI